MAESTENSMANIKIIATLGPRDKVILQVMMSS